MLMVSVFVKVFVYEGEYGVAQNIHPILCRNVQYVHVL